MSSPDFAQLLSKRADEVKRPAPLPIGMFKFVVKKKEFGTSSKKHTPYVRFTAAPVEYASDVEESDLPEDWQKKEYRHDFYLTDDAMFLLTDFCEACGLSVEGRGFDELVEEIPGSEFWCYVAQQPSDQPGDDRVFNRFSGYRSSVE